MAFIDVGGKRAKQEECCEEWHRNWSKRVFWGRSKWKKGAGWSGVSIGECYGGLRLEVVLI